MSHEKPELLAEERQRVVELHEAVGGGDIEAVASLLEEVDVNAQLNGRTALYFAAIKGHVGMVKLLLERGADVNAVRQSDGSTALHGAVEHEHAEVVLILLRSRANVDAQDQWGYTPLHRALRYSVALFGANNSRITDIVEYLLSYGADSNLRDSFEKTAKEHARYGFELPYPNDFARKRKDKFQQDLKDLQLFLKGLFSDPHSIVMEYLGGDIEKIIPEFKQTALSGPLPMITKMTGSIVNDFLRSSPMFIWTLLQMLMARVRSFYGFLHPVQAEAKLVANDREGTVRQLTTGGIYRSEVRDGEEKFIPVKNPRKRRRSDDESVVTSAVRAGFMRHSSMPSQVEPPLTADEIQSLIEDSHAYITRLYIAGAMDGAERSGSRQRLNAWQDRYNSLNSMEIQQLQNLHSALVERVATIPKPDEHLGIGL